MDNRYIGVFDSGIGGLTSVSCIMDMFPDERILFFGDTARTPYGSKAPETIKRFTLQIGEFMKNSGVKMMVAACNTISSVSLNVLSEKYPGVPVIGTIEPTAKVVAEKCDADEKIGILATRTTVATEMYPKSIMALKPEMKHIHQKACPAFVPLIEEGIIDNPIMDQTIKYYLDDFIRENDIDTLVLACTHYPLIAPNLERIYPGIRLVSSSKETAAAVGYALEKNDMRADGSQTLENTFYASDLSENFVNMIDLILKNEQDPDRIRFKNLDAISD